ncbi:arginine--tRNA ligase [Lacicoccus qingdaonensis]|uniref:Arginine--tRNA ligase n=1 Tax=Lacicoccus qingdaonensis TaxID=576118 RepID=A0A1G9FAW4_9BACL|nr:arginine--tRNA ligase [Salinicoccus qingdaonensis]SDK85510.1 arginyl-tRNA synthetase [Salinicoccus qingdaonensis]
MLKKWVAEDMHKILKEYLKYEEILEIIEIPANDNFGDFSFPTFTLSKLFRKSPEDIAENIKEGFQSELVVKTEVINGFVNFHIDRQKGGSLIMNEIGRESYGKTKHLQGQKLVMDFSSPNIAKPFSMGHLRATILGDSLSKILEQNSAKVTGINHLGDWGTQFGKLIVAYTKWGEKKAVEADPIKELFQLYTHFHIEAEKNPSLDDEAREAFSKLELGHKEYTELWQWFRDVSMVAFELLYNQLNVSFDHIQGESFYNKHLSQTVELLEEKNLLEYDDGAYIIRLNGIPPALIKKRDGASLYITRDVAAMLYRVEKYEADKILYVVGQEQSIHFEQLSQVAEMLDVKTEIEHIPFGMILKNGKKMSTRKGEVVLLEDIIKDVAERALQVISDKNPKLKDKELAAGKIAIGAIKFHDLKNDRMNSYDFNIEDMLKFDGETATYVNYTNSRIQSILRKNMTGTESGFVSEDSMWPILKHMSSYEEVLVEAANRYSPSVICKYVMQLCRLFNTYYGQGRIIGSSNEKSKLMLLQMISRNIKEAMKLLGIETMDSM